MSDWYEAVDEIGNALATEWFIEDGVVHIYRKYEVTKDDDNYDGLIQMGYVENFVGWILPQLAGRVSYAGFVDLFTIPKNKGWFWPTCTYCSRIIVAFTPRGHLSTLNS